MIKMKFTRSSFILDNCSKILMFDDWMFPENFGSVHFGHSLNNIKITPAIFSHEAAPLMLSKTGEDYVKGVPFLTSMMNFTQFKYMKSSLYFSTRLV